jgi:hypothetical protein
MHPSFNLQAFKCASVTQEEMPICEAYYNRNAELDMRMYKFWHVYGGQGKKA